MPSWNVDFLKAEAKDILGEVYGKWVTVTCYLLPVTTYLYGTCSRFPDMGLRWGYYKNMYFEISTNLAILPLTRFSFFFPSRPKQEGELSEENERE